MTEEEIKKASDNLNTSNINNLLQYKQTSAVAKVEILSSDNSCDHCKNQNRKVYTVEEAIKTRPLAHRRTDNSPFHDCIPCKAVVVF